MAEQLELDMRPRPAAAAAPAAPPRRADTLNADLMAAHRERMNARRAPPSERPRRDGRKELYCPSCGERIALELAKLLSGR